MTLKCENCGYRFDAEEARMVFPDETDGVPWYEKIPACPRCRSTEVRDENEVSWWEDIRACIRCGGEAEEGSEYCEHCAADLWG